MSFDQNLLIFEKFDKDALAFYSIGYDFYYSVDPDQLAHTCHLI
jgi:hypothetical protein